MYEITAFYLYKAVFMTELLVAEILMSIGMKRRPFFALRIALVCAVCIGFSLAIPVISYNAVYCSAVFIVMFAFSLPAMKLCFEENWMSVIFRGFAAYTTQHVAYQIFDLTMLAIGFAFGQGASIGGMYGSGEAAEYFSVILYAPRFPSASVSMSMFGELQRLFTYCSYLFIYILTYAVGFSFAAPRLKESDKFRLKNSTLFVFVVCFVIFNVIISSVVTYYSGSHFDALYVILLALYNVACSFFVMYLMFEVVFRRQLKRGFTIANRLLKQSAEQYELAKQNVELINLRCHDLKHQIRLMNTGEIGSEAIGEIERMIAIYDAKILTGNEALDIILTEKSLYCNKHGIKLYCIVDGSLLSFVSDADLYSLFGNLLDNAIEAVERLADGKRFINLSVRAVNGFPTVSTSNCLAEPLVFDDGLPQTTKANRDLHGYGMKSIRLVCKKYNGEMTVTARDGMFDVNIVFMH